MAARRAYVREALPLLQSQERYPLPLWNQFGPCLFLAILGGVRYWLAYESRHARGTLLMVWTGVMIAATFAQVRFAYYLGVNVALFAGFACDAALLRAGVEPPPITERLGSGDSRHRGVPPQQKDCSMGGWPCDWSCS